MRIGRNASDGGKTRSFGQMYRAVTIPHAMKLNAMLEKKPSCDDMGDLMVSLLLGVAERPSSRDVAARARGATAAFLHLHPPPTSA